MCRVYSDKNIVKILFFSNNCTEITKSALTIWQTKILILTAVLTGIMKCLLKYNMLNSPRLGNP